jgi:hypothetical protein
MERDWSLPELPDIDHYSCTVVTIVTIAIYKCFNFVVSIVINDFGMNSGNRHHTGSYCGATSTKSFANSFAANCCIDCCSANTDCLTAVNTHHCCYKRRRRLLIF